MISSICYQQIYKVQIWHSEVHYLWDMEWSASLKGKADSSYVEIKVRMIINFDKISCYWIAPSQSRFSIVLWYCIEESLWLPITDKTSVSLWLNNLFSILVDKIWTVLCAQPPCDGSGILGKEEVKGVMMDAMRNMSGWEKG